MIWSGEQLSNLDPVSRLTLLERETSNSTCVLGDQITDPIDVYVIPHYAPHIAYKLIVTL